MRNYDESVKINHSPNWLYILDHTYRILIIADSGSGKTNISEVNKTSKARYWQNLSICQRSLQTKEPITYQ